MAHHTIISGRISGATWKTEDYHKIEDMKNKTIFTLALIFNGIIAQAQIPDSITNYSIDLGKQPKQCFMEAFINTGIGFGMQLNQYQNDFGLGLNLSSPSFINERMAFRLRGNIMFNEHIQNTTTVRTPYSNISLGMVGATGKVGNYIRIYGEGGMILLLPSDKFSEENLVLGGYGMLGIEFFMNRFCNYFLETGYTTTGAKEDKIVTQPYYSNGLIISSGLRIFLKK